jgi:hypothetical protein
MGKIIDEPSCAVLAVQTVQTVQWIPVDVPSLSKDAWCEGPGRPSMQL